MESAPPKAQTLIMTARDEILAVLPAVRARTGRVPSLPKDVINQLQRRGTSYKPLTFARRTTALSRCGCVAGR